VVALLTLPRRAERVQPEKASVPAD